jgi:hypothetical protein
VLRRVLDGSFTPADRARPTVGAGYARILAKALAREPADRYPSAADLSDDLRSELKLVGFDDPRRELERFLTHSEAYATEYVPRVCERLVEVGRRARTEGDVALAASCFNRALAFRPDDTELLSLVSGLARSERVREIARRSALIAVGGVTLGLAVFGTARLFSPPVTVGSSALKPVLRTPHARANERPVSVVQSGNPVPSVPVPGTTASAKLRLPAVPLVPRPKPTRVVQVHIRGAAGRLKIDGVETPWYGRTHTLEVGRHVLEFIPPNLDCCIAPEPKAIDVRSGDGIQVESGEIRFKDAVVSFVGPQGSEASCADLATHLGPGSSKSVQMSGSQLDVSCTIFPPPSAGADPRTEQVSLHPGATAVLSWP